MNQHVHEQCAKFKCFILLLVFHIFAQSLRSRESVSSSEIKERNDITRFLYAYKNICQPIVVNLIRKSHFTFQHKSLSHFNKRERGREREWTSEWVSERKREKERDESNWKRNKEPNARKFVDIFHAKIVFNSKAVPGNHLGVFLSCFSFQHSCVLL